MHEHTNRPIASVMEISTHLRTIRLRQYERLFTRQQNRFYRLINVHD